MASEQKSGRLRGARVATITAVIVIAVLAAYYYRFRAQLDNINDRNFRSLATMSTQIEDAVTGYVSVVQSVLENECSDIDSHRLLQQQTSIYPAPAKELTRAQSGRGFAIERDPDHVNWLIIDAHRDKAITARKGCREPPKEVHAKVNLSEDFQYFMPDDGFGGPFDLVVVAMKSGEVIYQPANSQLHLTNVRPLFRAGSKGTQQAGESKAKPGGGEGGGRAQGEPAGAGETETERSDGFGAAIQTSSLREVEVAGLAYSLYLQPIKLAAIQPAEFKSNNEWVLCALVRPRKLYAEALRLRYPYLFFGMGCVALGFLALPWIKIRYLSRSDRLRRAHIVMGAFSLLVSPAVILVLATFVYQTVRCRNEAEGQMEEVSRKVATAIDAELREVVTFLRAESTRLAGSPIASRKWDEGEVLDEKHYEADGRNAYAFMNVMFWTSDSGRQIYKRSSYSDATPYVNISTQRLFRRFQESHGWRFSGDNREFFVESLLAPTTGTNQAVIGTHVEALPNPLDDKDPITSAFLVAQPRSLFRVVLPPGFGFCLVDVNTGEVRFHSDYRRNLNENLFVETGNDPELQAAIFGGQGTFVHTGYRGRQHLMYVSSLDGFKTTPVVLVVFVDKLFYETIAGQTALATIFLYGIYLVGLIFVAVLSWVVFRPIKWLNLIWPQSAQIPRYLRAALLMLLFTIASFGWMLQATSGELIYGAPLFSLLALAVVICLLTPDLRPHAMAVRAAAAGVFCTSAAASILQPARPGLALVLGGLTAIGFVVLWRTPPVSESAPTAPPEFLIRAYLWMLLAVVVIVSIVPAVALFRGISACETELFVQSGQKKIASALSERQDDMKWQNGDEPRLAKALAAEWKRIEDKRRDDQANRNTWGLYCSPFHDSQVTALDNPPPDSKYRLPSYLEELLYILNPPVNPIARDVLAVVKRSAPDGQSGGQERRLSSEPVIYSTKLPDGRFVQIKSNVESQTRQEPRLTLAFVAAVCFVGLAYYSALRFAVKAVFRLDWRMPYPNYRADGFEKGRSYLLLAPAGAKDPGLGLEMPRLDFAQLAVTGTWSEAAQLPFFASGKTVCIRDLDRQMEDPALDEKKLELLEKVIYTRGAHVVLMSNVDPLHRLESQRSNEQMKQRWGALLKNFDRMVLRRSPDKHREPLKRFFEQRLDPSLDPRLRAQLAELLANECAADERLESIGPSLPLNDLASREQALAEIGTSAAAHYTWLWDTCSPEERWLLYQVARSRFVNPLAEREAQELWRRGLLGDDPLHPVMNESFEQFIKAQRVPERPARQASGWSRFENSAVLVLLALSLPLLVTFVVSRGESLQSAIGYVTGALGIVGTLIKLTTGRDGGKVSAPAS